MSVLILWQIGLHLNNSEKDWNKPLKCSLNINEFFRYQRKKQIYNRSQALEIVNVAKMIRGEFEYGALYSERNASHIFGINF